MNHDPRTDSLTQDGAYRLKARIERYWKARGVVTECSITRVYDPKQKGHSNRGLVMYAIRSDLRIKAPENEVQLAAKGPRYVS